MFLFTKLSSRTRSQPPLTFFTDFSHSFCSPRSSPPHPFQIPGSPSGQSLNRNSFVCSFGFWWKPKSLTGTLWCHEHCAAFPVVQSSSTDMSKANSNVNTSRKNSDKSTSFVKSSASYHRGSLPLSVLLKSDLCCPAGLLLPLVCQNSQLCPLPDLMFLQTYSTLFILLDAEETWTLVSRFTADLWPHSSDVYLGLIPPSQREFAALWFCPNPKERKQSFARNVSAARNKGCVYSIIHIHRGCGGKLEKGEIKTLICHLFLQDNRRAMGNSTFLQGYIYAELYEASKCVWCPVGGEKNVFVSIKHEPHNWKDWSPTTILIFNGQNLKKVEWNQIDILPCGITAEEQHISLKLFGQDVYGEHQMAQMTRWKVQSRHKSVPLCLRILHLQCCLLTLRAEGEGKTKTVLICCNSLKSRAAGWVIEFPPQKKTKGLLRTGRRGEKWYFR